MNILQVNAIDNYGGAARIAWNLFQSYRNRGHRSWLAVGDKRSDDPDVCLMPNDAFRSSWSRFWIRIGERMTPFAGKVKGAGLIRRFAIWHIGQHGRWLRFRTGHEDFDFPATRHLLSLVPCQPHIIHCHNLHGRYFDLRALPHLSARIPMVLTLHDAWLLSGHCAHSFDCQRWQEGCGNCPDLAIPPAIVRDGTAYNWQRKRNIYARSRLYVATPSRWLMNRVEKSMLAEAIVGSKVIPNGVNLSVFHRADRNEARKALGIPGRMKILLSTAKSKRRDVWQDHQMMRDAICHVSRRIGDIRLRVILLGRKYAKERVGAAEYVSVPYQESKTLALYYQSADAYVQPSRADTFPNAVLEALACGIPVLATAVGGIPEQVKGLRVPFCKGDNGHMGRFGMDEATGVLVAPCDVKGMAEGIKLLLKDEGLCRRLGYNGAGDTTKRFDLDLQAETYLNWYEGMIEERAQDRRIPSSIKRDTSMKARESLDHESGA